MTKRLDDCPPHTIPEGDLNASAENINRFCWASPGGRPQDSSLSRAALRAELAELISRHCIGHAAKITDAILSQFVVAHKPLKGTPK